MALLNVDQLRFGQGEWQLAADFKIERHSLTVVIGASGAGKSTPVSYTHLTLPTNREV